MDSDHIHGVIQPPRLTFVYCIVRVPANVLISTQGVKPLDIALTTEPKLEETDQI